MSTPHLISNWIYQAYLYIVSIIALIICIIGAVTLVNLTIRTVVFGITDSWYENPRTSCQHETFTETNGRMPAYTSLEECIVARAEDKKMQAKYDLARDVSQGVAMVLVGFPVYYYHWRRIQKLHQA